MKSATRLAWAFLLLLPGCSDGEPSSSTRSETERGSGRAVVFSVNYPLAYFAERIGGDRVEVRFPAPPNVDPAAWSPDPEIVAAYQRADRILVNGAGYAKWLGRASLRRGRLIDTSASFRDRILVRDESVTHAHGPSGAHSHAGTAATIWLDPTLAIEQARAIAEALVDLGPGHASEFRERLAELEAQLRELDQDLARAAAAIRDRPLLFSHPVYAYLEQRYDLDGRSLTWEPDEAPSPAMWRALEALLREHPAHVLIWEAPPLAETARRLESLGLSSVVYAPCANLPAEGDWLSVMRDNARRLRSLGESSEAPATGAR